MGHLDKEWDANRCLSEVGAIAALGMGGIHEWLYASNDLAPIWILASRKSDHDPKRHESNSHSLSPREAFKQYIVSLLIPSL